MKKKRNLLTIISSLFGCIAICGFSMFGLFSRSREKSVQTNALVVTSMYETQRTNSSISYSSLSGGATIYYSYTISYNRFIEDSSIKYGFILDMSYYISAGTGYSVKASNGVDNLSLYYQFTRESQPLANGTTCNLKFTSILVQNSGLPNLDQIRVGYSIYTSVYTYVGGSPTYPCKVEGGNYNVFTNTSMNLNFPSFTLDMAESDYDLGFQEGYQTGYDEGYIAGQNEGYNNGYDVGYDAGLTSADTLVSQAYQNGYNEGYNEGIGTNSTAMTIISGIFQVALVPINFFLGIFNFEVLGINFTSIIQVLFTIALTIILVKVVMGRKGE